MQSHRPFYQRVSLWLGVLLVGYGLSFGLLIPFLTPLFFPSYLAKSHGIYLDFSRMAFNPFTFSLTLRDVRLDDQKGGTVLRVEAVSLALNPAALMHKRVTITTLRVVRPRVFVTIDTQGALNLAQILPPAASLQETPSSPSAMEFFLKAFYLENGSLTYTDASKPEMFSTTLQGLHYTARDISTAQGAVGAHRFGGLGSLLDALGWEGGVSLNPPKFYGNIWLENAKLEAFWKYLLHASPYVLTDARATLRLPYLVEWDEKGLHVTINGAGFVLKDVTLLEENQPFVKALSLALSDVHATLSVQETGLSARLHKATAEALGLDVTYAQALRATLHQAVVQTIHASLEHETFSLALPFVALERLWVAKQGENTPFGTLERLHVEGITFNEDTLHVKEIALEAPTIKAVLMDDGIVDLAHILPPSTPATEPKKPQTPLVVHVETLRLHQGEAELVGTPQPHRLSQFSLHATPLSSTLLAPITYTFRGIVDGARIANEGSLTLSPFHAQGTLSLSHPNLPYYGPYLAPFFYGIFAKGTLELQSAYTADEKFTLSTNSSFSLHDIAIHDPTNTPLIRWKTLQTKELRLHTAPFSLHVSGVSLTEPYASLHIYSDMRTNVGALFPQTSDQAPKETSAPLEVTLSRMGLEKGVVDFKDDSLPLPFATQIHSLKGTLSTVDFTSTQPSKLALTGAVDQYGYVQIDGEMLPFDLANHIDIGVLFKNIDLTRLSPYSGKFVGYAISDGRLDLDLGYKVRRRALQGSNTVVLQTLTLGERIESPEALNLPLNLAIALLKDRNGRIDLNLPVHGDLNDPQFSYGAIIWRAVTNLLTNIITSPFRLLGSLLGIDGETLKAIDFDAGVATLLPSEQEKMVHYRKILEERPQLRLNITGTYHTARDTAALQEAKAQARIEAELKKGKAYEEILTAWFHEAFSKEAFEAVQKAHTKERALDKAGFHEALLDALKKSIAIPDQELHALADARGRALMEALKEAGVDPQKLTLKEPTEAQVRSERWIETVVEVGA